MATQLTKEEFWKLYKSLPKELQEAIFSNETAEYIATTSERYGVSEEKVPVIATQVGNVLLGLTLPGQLQATLIKELKLKKADAESMAQEINRFIFYPVKPALEQLHGGASVQKGQDLHIPTPRHDAQQEQQFPLEENEEPRTMPNEQKSEKTDPYREPTE